ncbi:MAG: protein translocase subunit SecF [Treponema sp.]|nr:protein translocase subunit SecF [Treponema sp.]MCL2237351.1 protein translocase subunit SecF [Treponema sp.]
MRKTIQFSRFFVIAAVISCLLAAFSISGYIFNKGFALGVDFQAGLLQEVQFAPTAFSLRWNGSANATFSYVPDRNRIDIVITGSGVENRTYEFFVNEHNTTGSLGNAIMRELGEIEIEFAASEETALSRIVISTQNNQHLSADVPFVIQYIERNPSIIEISEVRNAMANFSQGVSVQVMGAPEDRQFMIRVEDKEEGRVVSAEIVQELEKAFGNGSVAVLRSDYVDSRFSKDLTDQAGILVALTLLIILIYCTIRFKLQYAVGAVVAIMYDGLVMIAFMVWTRMEFTTLSIAAILTILGYSTNNTIIFFDRVRENLRVNPDNSFKDIINISLTGILGRTIITTASTMLAVLALFIFTTGSMKDFALALLVGMLSGVYTTLFIVSGFVNFWENQKIKQQKKKMTIG